MPVMSSVTSLAGALRINYSLGLAAYEDLGGRVAALISQVTLLQNNLSVIQLALVSANASAVTFSALSGVNFGTYATVSNFASV